MVVFKEVLPNPSGKDTEGEWVKVINIGENPTSLNGWTLTDKGGGVFSFSRLKKNDQELLPGSELILPFSVTKISLNNSNEKLVLTDPGGNEADIIQYTGPTGDDEIIFGNNFKKINPNQASIGEISDYTYTNNLISGEGINTSPLFVALFLAVVFGVGMALLSKGFIEEK